MSQMQRCPGCDEWRWPYWSCPRCGAPKTANIPENDMWEHGPDVHRQTHKR